MLPPGWSRIPLRRGTEQVITKILDRTFAGLPRDRVASVSHDLQLCLRDLAGQARDSSGLDLYVPTERMHGVTATASFVVAEVSVVSADQVNPALLAARLVADSEHTTAVQLAGTTGTRTEHVAAADVEHGIEHASRGVDYVLPVPADQDRWVIVSFSTLGAGNPTDAFAQLLVELFAAIMTTFRGGRREWVARDRGGAHFHLPDPRLMPLQVYLEVWDVEGERDAALRELTWADDPETVEPPVVEAFATLQLDERVSCLIAESEVSPY